MRIPKPPYVPAVFERFQDREERLRLEREQEQTARTKRVEQSRIYQRLVHFRETEILTEEEDRPVLYPQDRPDVLAAKAEYVAQMQRMGEPPNARLLTQINAEISAMSGVKTKDNVHFLAYDLNRSQEASSRPAYSFARSMFKSILRYIRDLPRKEKEAEQQQSLRLRFEKVMRNAQTIRGTRPLIPVKPW